MDMHLAGLLTGPPTGYHFLNVKIELVQLRCQQTGMLQVDSEMVRLREESEWSESKNKHRAKMFFRSLCNTAVIQDRKFSYVLYAHKCSWIKIVAVSSWAECKKLVSDSSSPEQFEGLA